MTVLRQVAQRLLRLGVVLAAAVVLTFAMVHLVPGDPARSIAGPQADQATVDVARAAYGLDQPLAVQFKSYVGGLLRGDLGMSFRSREPVASVISANIAPTAQLAAGAMTVIVVAGIAVGLLFGWATQNGRRRIESFFSAASGALVSFPSYLTATFLVFLFAVTWPLFPVAGATGVESLVLPSLALALSPTMVVARVVRVRAAEVTEQPYIRTARSKRLSESRIYLRHVLPNTMPAALAICGVLFASILGGAVIVETVFARPGLGSALVAAVIIGDYPVVQGITIVFGVAIVLANLVVDLLLPVVDPPMRGT